MREGQATTSGHLRLFATIDLGQSALTRLLARFLRDHPRVTAELGYTNRPVQMIEEGYDAGVVAGHLADERLVARPLGELTRRVVAAPELLRRARSVKDPSDLASWPWAALSGRQFGGQTNSVSFVAPGGGVRTLRIAPVFTSEGVTSLREAVLAGLALAVLPDWLIRDDLRAGRLAPVLPRWSARPIPLSVIYLGDRRRPSRVQAFIEFVEAHLPRLVAEQAT